MTLPPVISRRLLRIAVVMLVMIAVLPIAPSASAVATGALTLNGTTQYVTMGASPGLRSTTFTLELWFRRTGTGVTTSTGTGGVTSIVPLITKGRGEGETAPADVNYFLGIDTATNKLAADFEEAQSASTPSLNHPIIGNTVITSNVWHHAAATYDGTTWRLFLDGAADGSLAVGQPPNTALTSHTVVGSSLLSTGVTPAGFFQGDIDEVRIWNAARSQGQIQGTMTSEIAATPGLIGQWRLNEGTGTAVADSSGSGFNATTVGSPAWTTGTSFNPVASNALTLNGSTQYVNMGAAPGLRSTTFTLELWFRRTGTGDGADTGAGGISNAIPLITKGRAEGETAAANVNYFFGIDAATNRLVADFEEADSGTTPGLNHPITGSTVITSGVWHHAAATYDGTTWRLYLDGAAEGTLAVGQPPNTALTSPTVIGSSLQSGGAAPDGFFLGQIDEARIWNTARSQADIQAAINTEIGPTNGLLGLWHLNATSGTNAADGSGNVTLNNGTTAGSPAWAPGTGPFLSPTSGLQLNGTSQYVTMGASPGLRSTTFTLELWFRRTGTGDGADTGSGGISNAIPLITKGRAEAETAAANVNYFFGIDAATNRLVADFEEADSGTTPGLNHPITGTTVITSNVWHHAAATYDGTTWRLYLDGAAEGTLAVGQPPNTALTSPTVIGSSLQSGGAAPDGFFLGQIDEARIWNVPRTQGQIQSTMNAEVSAATGLLGSWHLNDGVGTTAIDSAGANPGTLVAAPTWTYGMLLGAAPTNTAPVVDSVVIDQASPQTNDSLTATVTSHDAESNPVTYAYQWTKNGADISGATSATLDLSVAGNGDRGDLIRLRVTASDASLTSAPLTSAARTVQNSTPSATVSLDDHLPGTNATLTATATSDDADGDTVTLTYVWTVDGVVRQTTAATASLTDTFDLSAPGNGGNGDEVIVTVTPNDGTVDGLPVADTASIGNALPVVDSVAIDQATPLTDDVLSATVTSHDDDDDPLTPGYQWTKNGTDISGATSSTLDLSVVGNGDKGDVIRLRVIVDDGNDPSAPVTSDPVTILNSAPTATVELDDDSPATNDTLTATVTGADADDDTVTFTYLWTVDGEEQQTTVTTSTTDAFDLSLAGNGDDGQVVVVTVTPSDGTVNGSGVADTATVGNSTPVVDSVSIDQAGPQTDDVLSATVTSHDDDDEPLTTSYQWTKNGGDIAGATSATLDLSVAGNGDEGNVIRVRVTVSDGVATSPAATSDPVTILNTAPSATVSLDDHSPSTGAILTATATSSDDDDDTVTLTYVWTVEGVVQQTTVTTSTTDTFDLSVAGNGDNGDEVVLTVTPNDGDEDGAPVSDTATVGNEPPVVDTVAIDQPTPRTNDTLSVTVTSHDPDDNPVTHAYQWTRNGNDISGATDATLDLSVLGNGDKGDLIRVRVTASDGSATSTPVTSSAVTVLNTAPTATVTLNDHNPGTNATLTATATCADDDGDTISLTYVWTVNGVTRQTTTTTSLTDTFDGSLVNNGNNGDTIVVTVTPNDGTTDGSAATDSATIGNTPPTVHSVVIAPTDPRTNDVIGASVGSSDPDSGPQTPSYQWTRNGIDIAGATNATLNLATAGNGDRGDVIRVRVTVSDGSASSDPFTSSPVNVLNTQPTATVSLNDHAPGTDDTLVATATRADVDGDTVSLTYLWTVDSVIRKTTITTALTDTFDLALAGNGDAGQGVTVTVTPNDGTDNGTAAADSAAVTGGAAPPIFEDDFTAGNLLAWTSFTRITIDNTIGSPAAPSARANVTNQSAFAYRDLGTTTMTPCMSVNVNRAAGAADLFRLRTAANGAVIKAVVTSTGTLQLRSDVSGATINSNVALGTGWHNVELCGTVGSNTTWDLLRDGVVIVNDWVANTGTVAVGRIQIGDTAAKSFTFNFDHVRLDLVPGEGGGGADTQGPTTPGQPAGTSPSTGTIQISWSASIDASPPITYRVYRDGNPTSIGETTSTSFTDPGLTSGTTHTYTVDAVDSLDNPSLMSAASSPILVSGGATPPIFSDDFTSGNLLAWTSFTRITIDNAIGSPAAPSARAGVTSQSAFAYRDLGSTTMTPCMSVNVNRTSGAADLFRLRTAANGPVIKAVVTAAGALQLRSDVSGATINSNVQLGTGWHSIELCGTVGSSTTWDLLRDGAVIVNDWVANTGTTPVGRIQIGDTAAKTFTFNFDHVRIDLVPGEGGGGDTEGPTTPGTPTGSSPSSGMIQIQWTASTDASPPITYRVYRDGSPTSIGQTTSLTFMDPGLTPGTSHTYTVDAVDSLNNVSVMSGTSASITVTGPPDTQGPTTPGTPTGSSPSNGMIQIQWTASTDASPPITYRVYRDGNPTSIGQTTSLTFMDPGLTPGTSHTYTVDAVDSLNNPSLMSGTSASILVSGGATPPIYADDFSSGNLLAWTSFTRITVDNAIGSPAAPSARASVTSQTAFAYRDLASTTMTPCFSVNVNLASGTGVDLFRLRTAAGGAIVKVFVHASGTLQIRSDFASTTVNSGVQMGTGWHAIELCGTVGSAGGWNLYRDGVQIVTNWTADTGTTAVGRVQIGDTAAKTFTANFDNVRLDLVLGG